MTAIITKYLGPTDCRGARISASDSDGARITIHYDSSRDTEDAHWEACVVLCLKMGWTGKLASGWLRTGFAWVFVGKSNKVERWARE